MLVLGRREGERIIVTAPDGSQMEVMLVEIEGSKVRLGFAAPADWKINRIEVQNRTLCPHGFDPSSCSSCMVESDIAFDAARERRTFGR